MKKYNTRAVVLKSLKYKDSDRIFTLFTKENGKISAIARGVRKISSRRSGNLDTLNLVLVSIYEDSAGFKSIEEVKTIDSFRNLKKDFNKCLKAYYLIELIHRSVEEDAQYSEIFDLLLKCLKSLDKNSYAGDLYVSYFEMGLMKILGYQMGLEKCTVCRKDLNNDWGKYFFNLENGSVECGSCSKLGINISKKTAMEMQNIFEGKISKEAHLLFPEIDKLMKMYVGRKLESKFKSLEIDFN